MGEIKHIAVIMDGNGRWAKAKGKSRSFGHRQGAKTLEKIIEHGFSIGLEAMSFYAFSTENWARPEKEVNALLKLLTAMLVKNVPNLVKNEIRLVISGDISVLNEKRQALLKDALERTKAFKKTVNICFNYGAQTEILRAVNLAISSGVKSVDKKLFESYLYTADMPEVDMIIRTGGEQRLSNFLLFQAAYAELYFTPVMFPDFSSEHFDEAIGWYLNRERRFGNVQSE